MIINRWFNNSQMTLNLIYYSIIILLILKLISFAFKKIVVKLILRLNFIKSILIKIIKIFDRSSTLRSSTIVVNIYF